MISDDAAAAYQFLHWLYGDDAPYWLTTWLSSSRYTQWFRASSLDKAATYAVKQAQQCDVYLGVGLRGERLQKGRGESADVIGIPGLWVEIDIQHSVHTKVNLPKTIDDGFALVREALPLIPTLIIHSGYGIHVYWLFRELWLFEDADDRQAAYHLLHRLQATIQAVAKRHGWDVDGTYDLARVLRIPGSFNRKIPEDPKLVEILEAHDEQRYNPSDFPTHLLEVDDITYEQTIREEYAGELKPIDLHTLHIPAGLKTLIRYGDNVNAATPYPSRSEAMYDAMKWLIKAGCDDQTIMSLLLDSRYAVSEKPREKGRKWLAGDLARTHARLNGYRRAPTGDEDLNPSKVKSEGESVEANVEVEDEPHTAEHGDDQQQEPAEEIHLTDVGNGLRMIQQFGADICYVVTWKKWLLWREGLWIIDEGSAVEWHAKQVIAGLYRWAQEKIGKLAVNIPEDEDLKQERAKEIAQVNAILKWAHTSENGSHIDLMVRRARVNPKVQIKHDQLDANPMLFHVANGTIDLRTGERRAPRRSDFITKRSPVIYDPDAVCPRWNRFLQRIQGYPQPNEHLSNQERSQNVDGNQSYEFGPHSSNRPILPTVRRRGELPVARESSLMLGERDPRCHGISARQAVEFIGFTAIRLCKTLFVRAHQ